MKNNQKSLVIYFSRADENYAVGYISKGNTEYIAEDIRDLTGADIFKVERKMPYAKDYDTCIKQAEREIQHGEKPEIKNTLSNIDGYDIIYIGSPIYWGYVAPPLVTQLEKLNWNGKIVRPFTTHEGSGLAEVPEQLAKICKGATVQKGLAIRGSQAKTSKDRVKAWLESF